MLERTYNPTRPYHYALYGRMSDPKQNRRSPDQQFNTISETIARCGYPWVCVSTYRDDGISGRYIRKRPGLQQMLLDIEIGRLTIDLIAVDTLERLGRADEIAELRRKLFVEYGILVVAADNHFADPTGVVGKAVGLVENIRSTEDGRIKSHNVVRGKKDAARLKRWPGGPAPFGFRLKPVVNEAASPPEVHNVLEPEPRAAAALALAFARAAETGEGDLRLAQWWNASLEIPEDMKPISPFTMGYRLENPIAIGTLRWGKNRTGVVNDTRVVEANPDGAELIPDFCPALVSVELYDRVQQQRRARGEQIRRSRKQTVAKKDVPGKLIAPQARGLTLKYLLTGLVRCGGCNASMRPVPSGRHSKAGRRYVYYVCPRHYDGACTNDRHVPEDRLREAVTARLRARLFPPPGQAGQAPSWLPELVELVRQEQQRSCDYEPGRAAAEQEELRQLGQQLEGWTQTLSNPQLAAVVRMDIETRYAESKGRQQFLLRSAAARQASEGHLERALSPAAVVAELHRLSEVLASYNPTLGNLELSRHIDVITCHPDGRVELRGTFVGLFAGAAELLSRDQRPPAESPSSADGSGFAPVTPRRRGRLRVPTLSAAGREPGDVDTALDPERFGGLPEPFFWQAAFVLPETQSWAEANAEEVARLRASGMTMEALAQHLGKTVPTIRNALRHARAKDPSLNGLPTKQPRRRWAEDHADEVLRLKQQGMSTPAIARQLGKSEPTIRAALKHAERRPRADQVTPPEAGDNGPAPGDTSQNTET
jgi:DNA invertase Pin-like site-specific DNA recombinase